MNHRVMQKAMANFKKRGHLPGGQPPVVIGLLSDSPMENLHSVQPNDFNGH